ncbi:hypothetical protein FACS1894159_10550 [Bacteroidia bacterium]|nr:hypothetical protein FACS1894159_10550 [Bacteroidia bacterium]
MKRLLLIIALLVCGIAVASAQIVYKPFIPQRSSTSAIDPFPNTYRPNPAPAYSAPAVTKVSEQIVTLDAYDVKNAFPCKVQVREVVWSNNNIIHTMVGIKSGEQWLSVNLEVKYIANMLSEPNIEREAKEFLLQCNEVATHLAYLSGENTVFLIGLREQ